MIDDTTSSDRPVSPPVTDTTDEPAPVTAAQTRFQSCRWRKPPENGSAAYCTHRDVLPMAGTTGFNPDSWCPDCGFYKLRRVPRREY
jgi:hypothetical protein